ncbi:hypothetical protein GCM10010236_31450 [Streptomyces eurythermus]|nr:hypothetical protein GCM10010236_31450 [Streptomyces eurythermus]
MNRISHLGVRVGRLPGYSCRDRKLPRRTAGYAVRARSAPHPFTRGHHCLEQFQQPAVRGIPNGTRTDAVTGDVRTVSREHSGRAGR